MPTFRNLVPQNDSLRWRRGFVTQQCIGVSIKWKAAVDRRVFDRTIYVALHENMGENEKFPIEKSCVLAKLDRLSP
jgi:hypothetical protein